MDTKDVPETKDETKDETKESTKKSGFAKQQAKKFWDEYWKGKESIETNEFKKKLGDFLHKQEKDDGKYLNEYPDNFIHDLVDRFFLLNIEDKEVKIKGLERVLVGFGGNLKTVFQVINDNLFQPHPTIKGKFYEFFHGHDKKEVIHEALGTQKDGGGWYCLRYSENDNGLLLTYNKQTPTKKKVQFVNVPLKYVKMKKPEGMKWRANILVPAKQQAVKKKFFFESLGDFIKKMTELGKIRQPRSHQISYDVLGTSISDAEEEETKENTRPNQQNKTSNKNQR